MDKETIKKALTQLNDEAKRKFTQKYDLIITLKDLDAKSTSVDFYVTLNHPMGKKKQILGIVGSELAQSAKENLDFSITQSDLEAYKTDKKAVKKIAQTYDWVVAQANLMGQVATIFGKALGPRGKMPNPKAGCVVPPNADLKSLKEKLLKTLRVQNKKMFAVQAIVGSEDMSADDVADNILTLYNALVKALPNNENNIKTVFVKKTMGKPVRV